MTVENESLKMYQEERAYQRRASAKKAADAERERKGALPDQITIREQHRCKPPQLLECILSKVFGVEDVGLLKDSRDKISTERELLYWMKHYRLLPRDVRGADKIFSAKTIKQWNSIKAPKELAHEN